MAMAENFSPTPLFRLRLPGALAAALFGLGVLAAPARAAQEAPASPPRSELVPPPTNPVEVGVAGFVIDVAKISGADQSFTADVAMQAQWKDPRLAKRGPGIYKLDEVWHPLVAIANARNTKTLLPDVVEVSEDGMVTYRQRIAGEFSARFELHDFPSDTQKLPIEFVVRGENAHQVRLVPLPGLVGRAENFTISDWSLGKPEFHEKPYRLPGLGMELPGIELSLQAKRLVGYYIGTIMVTSGIILCMASLVFWLGLDAINPRISVSVTSMLTLVAHRFVVQNELPRLPYFTKMDYFLLGAAILVLLGLVGVVAVHAIGKTDTERASRLNKRLRWLHPIAFVALFVAALL